MFFSKKEEPLYIISDVHGCAKSLHALIEQLPHKGKSCLVFVGDLIDRGKYSAQVVEFVKEGGYPCVIGNHEQMMLDAFEDSLQGQMYGNNTLRNMAFWQRNGGDITDRSYNGKSGAMLRPHLDWMKALPAYLEFDIPDENDKTLFITHGFGLPFWEEREDPDMKQAFIWERLKDKREQTYLDYPVFNVFGHDVQESALPCITPHYAAIDTGCVYEGKLCALEWPSKRVFLQENIG